MLLKKLRDDIKKELKEGEELTKDALHKMNEVLMLKEIPETVVYKGWGSIKKLLGVGREEDTEKKDWMYNSGLIHGEKEQAKDELAAGETEPNLQHPSDYHKRVQKVPPGFAFKSGYEVPIEPIEKKYKKKNPYKPED